MRYKHRRIYTEKYGKIPPYYEVHPIDGNHSNNEPENLIAVPKEVHASLHRAKAILGQPLPNRKEVERRVMFFRGERDVLTGNRRYNQCKDGDCGIGKTALRTMRAYERRADV